MWDENRCRPEVENVRELIAYDSVNAKSREICNKFESVLPTVPMPASHMFDFVAASN